jgi:hypothetical protein
VYTSFIMMPLVIRYPPSGLVAEYSQDGCPACVGGGGAVAVRRSHLGVVVDHVDLHALRVIVPRSPSGFCAGDLSL